MLHNHLLVIKIESSSIIFPPQKKKKSSLLLFHYSCSLPHPIHNSWQTLSCSLSIWFFSFFRKSYKWKCTVCSFWDCFLSLNIMPSRFKEGATDLFSSFSYCWVVSVTWMNPRWVHHLPSKGHFRCSHVFAIMDGAVMNTCVQVLVWI